MKSKFACENIRKTVLIILFLGYIVGSGYTNVLPLCTKSEIETIRQDVTDFFANDINNKMSYIEIYGGIQRILGKKEIEDFTIFRLSYDKLVAAKPQDDNMEEKVREILPICEYLNSKEIPYFYVTSILPLQDEKDLPYAAVADYSHKNAQLLLKELDLNGINILNLRDDPAIHEINKADLFYRTDHHWTIETCFTSFCRISEEVERITGIKIDNRIKKRQFYDEYILEDSFLGSYGIKVGRYYEDREDFVVYVPTFDTDIRFESYDHDGNVVLEKEGKWLEALMNQEILANRSYNNKYGAFSNGGYIENRIYNNKSTNDSKILYISHSYGRPMTQYIALCCKEIRNIDPQPGRFEGNYLDYIDEFQPDIVIMQIESEGSLIGNYDTGR